MPSPSAPRMDAVDPAYLAGLRDEIAACRRAYVLAAVGDIARLRAELSGSLGG